MSSSGDNADSDNKTNAGPAVGITVAILLLLVIAAIIWCHYHRKKQGVDTEKEEKDRRKDMNALAHTIPGSAPVFPQNMSDELTMSEMILTATNRGKAMDIMPVIDDNDKETSDTIITRNSKESITVYDQGIALRTMKNKGGALASNRKITDPEDTMSLMKQHTLQHYQYEPSRTITNAPLDSRKDTQEDSVIMEKGFGATLKDRVNRTRLTTETELTAKPRARNDESLYVTSRINESYPSKTEFTHDDDTYIYKFNYKGKYVKENENEDDVDDTRIDTHVDSDIYGVHEHEPIVAASPTFTVNFT